MQKITITETGQVFGPFHTVETTSDRYVCDGAHLPFSVVGEGVVSGCEADVAAPSADQINAPVLQQIGALELTVTPRRIREAVTTDAGKTWMAAIDAQIADLREQLVK